MPDFIVHLRTTPATTTPADVALRRFLKDAIRRQVQLLGAMRGLKCVSVLEVTDSANDNATEDDEQKLDKPHSDTPRGGKTRQRANQAE